ncbi:MTH1187 family thiamine-binding protein [Oceanithermus sp.]
MSVLMEFAVFPTDKGESVSAYVARVVRLVKESGHPHQLTAMGTIVETETMAEATELLNRAYAVLAEDCHRVYATAKFDVRSGPMGRLQAKVRAVEEKLRDG